MKRLNFKGRQSRMALHPAAANRRGVRAGRLPTAANAPVIAAFIILNFASAASAQIHRLDLSISRSDSAKLWTRDPFSSDYIDARVTYNGTTWDDVRLRFKGRSTRTFPKHSFRVRFPGKKLFFGARQINLHAMYIDRSSLREKLAWMLFADMGVLAPHAEYVALAINGAPQGLYLAVDRIDGHFLRNRGRTPGPLYAVDDEFALGDLTEQPDKLLRIYYKKEGNDDDQVGDLRKLIEAVNRTPAGSFDSTVSALFDRESILGWFTGNILMMMGDSYNKNYYLYHEGAGRNGDEGQGRWVVIPWDYDISFGQSGDPALPLPGSLLNEGFGYSFPPLMGPSNVLKDRLWREPAFREELRRRVAAMLETVFTPERMSRRIDSLAAVVRPEVERDPKKRGSIVDFDDEVAALKYFVTARRNFLLKTFVNPPSGTFDIVTLHRIVPGRPEYFVGVDGRQNAMMLFSHVQGLDSIRVFVHPDSLLPGFDSTRTIRRWIEITPFPPSAKFSATVEWMYEDLSSKNTEVPAGVKDERDCRVVWSDGRVQKEFPSSINPVANTVTMKNVTDAWCRGWFAIRFP